MDCSTQGFPILYYLLEFAQIHVHWISDAIQPSRPLLSPSSCPQSFPASGCFLMSQLFTTGGRSIGASDLASVLPMNIPGWFASELTGLISLQSKGLSRVFSSTTVRKHQFFGAQPSFMVQLSYLYMTTGKTIALTLWIFVGQVMSLLFFFAFFPQLFAVPWSIAHYAPLSMRFSSREYWSGLPFPSAGMSLLFNTLCRFVIAFLPRSKHLFISWQQSLSAVIFEPKKIN